MYSGSGHVTSGDIHQLRHGRFSTLCDRSGPVSQTVSEAGGGVAAVRTRVGRVERQGATADGLEAVSGDDGASGQDVSGDRQITTTLSPASLPTFLLPHPSSYGWAALSAGTPSVACPALSHLHWPSNTPFIFIFHQIPQQLFHSAPLTNQLWPLAMSLVYLSYVSRFIASLSVSF